LQDGSFHRFWGCFVGVNSSNLRAILFIYPWNVLQAAGSNTCQYLFVKQNTGNIKSYQKQRASSNGHETQHILANR